MILCFGALNICAKASATHNHPHTGTGMPPSPNSIYRIQSDSHETPQSLTQLSGGDRRAVIGDTAAGRTTTQIQQSSSRRDRVRHPWSFFDLNTISRGSMAVTEDSDALGVRTRRLRLLSLLVV
jgi:hypothetical protein